MALPTCFAARPMTASAPSREMRIEIDRLGRAIAAARGSGASHSSVYAAEERLYGAMRDEAAASELAHVGASGRPLGLERMMRNAKSTHARAGARGRDASPVRLSPESRLIATLSAMRSTASGRTDSAR